MYFKMRTIKYAVNCVPFTPFHNETEYILRKQLIDEYIFKRNLIAEPFENGIEFYLTESWALDGLVQADRMIPKARWIVYGANVKEHYLNEYIKAIGYNLVICQTAERWIWEVFYSEIFILYKEELEKFIPEWVKRIELTIAQMSQKMMESI